MFKETKGALKFLRSGRKVLVSSVVFLSSCSSVRLSSVRSLQQPGERIFPSLWTSLYPICFALERIMTKFTNATQVVCFKLRIFYINNNITSSTSVTAVASCCCMSTRHLRPFASKKEGQTIFDAIFGGKRSFNFTVSESVSFLQCFQVCSTQIFKWKIF